MYKEKIEWYFKKYEQEYLADLEKLIAIDSTRGKQNKNFPYGEGLAKALEIILEIAKRFGLYTENWENYLRIVEMMPGKKRKLDIMAHLDVFSNI